MARKHIEYRISNGLCIHCAVVNGNGKKTCDGCLAKSNSKRIERNSSGLCGCGRPLVQGRRRCAACRESLRKASYKKHRIKKALGLCFCGNQVMQGFQICERCRASARKREHGRVAKGLCRCGRMSPRPGKRTCVLCRDTKSRISTDYRIKSFAGYGGKCVCCGEADPNVLQLDHVNNDGNKHRRQLRKSTIYKWVIDNGFPATIQPLCGNCHLAKTRTGDCSYRRKDKS